MHLPDSAPRGRTGCAIPICRTANAQRAGTLIRMLLLSRRNSRLATLRVTRFADRVFKISTLLLIKRCKLKERYTVEVRAEVFNLSNTPPRGSPNTVLGSPGFGSITFAGDPRVIQLAAKMHF